MPPQIAHHLQKDIKIACVQFASSMHLNVPDRELASYADFDEISKE